LYRRWIRRTAARRRSSRRSSCRLAVHAYIAVLIASTTDAASTALLLTHALTRCTLAAAIAAFERFEHDQTEASRGLFAHVRRGRQDTSVVSVREEVGGTPLYRRRDIGSRKREQVTDGRDTAGQGEMVGAVERRLAILAAAVIVVMSIARSGPGWDAVRGATGALAVVSTCARADDHVLVRWERDRRVLVHLHRLDFDSAILGHIVKGLDARQTERGTRNLRCQRTIFLEYRSEKGIHIGDGPQFRRRRSIRRA